MTTATERFDDHLDPWIDISEVEQLTGLDRTRIMGDGTPERPGMVAQGTFPPPFRFTPKGKWYWRRSTILKWMEEAEKWYPWTPRPANDNTPDDEGDIE